MGIMLEALKEFDELLVHQGVVRQFKVKLLSLGLGWKLAME